MDRLRACRKLRPVPLGPSDRIIPVDEDLHRSNWWKLRVETASFMEDAQRRSDRTAALLQQSAILRVASRRRERLRVRVGQDLETHLLSVFVDGRPLMFGVPRYELMRIAVKVRESLAPAHEAVRGRASHVLGPVSTAPGLPAIALRF